LDSNPLLEFSGPLVSITSYPTQSVDSLAAHAELERVFAGWHSEILGLLYHLLGSWEAARQCLQETFSTCWQARTELLSVPDKKTWVFAKALSTVRIARTTAWQRSPSTLDSTHIEYDLDAAECMQLTYNEKMDELKHAISQLANDPREVFLLHENGQFSYEEIAELLQTSVGVVRSRMKQAITELRGAYTP
jgi:RNA polymerase sigma-70 factor (ECF subfamily)